MPRRDGSLVQLPWVKKMMDDFVGELKNILHLKDTTVPGDIVVLASDEPRMLVYALVTAIEPDKTKKGSWYHITMQVLAVPPREVVWTLREPQFSGKEIFSFSGIEHFMKAVRFEKETATTAAGENGNTGRSGLSKDKLRVVK